MNQQELKERESALTGEQFDIEWDIIEKLHVLIGASWDSNTVKLQIEKLIGSYDKVIDELQDVWDELEVQPNPKAVEFKDES